MSTLIRSVEKSLGGLLHVRSQQACCASFRRQTIR